MWLMSAPTSFGNTLIELFKQVNTTNPTIIAEREKLLAIKTLKNQAMAGWHPRVNLNGTLAPNSSEATMSTGQQKMSANQVSNSVGVNMAINLYEGGKTSSNIKIAEFRRVSAEQSLRLKEQDVFFSLVCSYLALLNAQEILNLHEQNHEVIRQRYERCKLMVELGKGTNTDVVQALARLEKAKADVFNAKNSVENAKEQLKGLTGTYVDCASTPDLSRFVGCVPKTVEDAEVIAGKNHPAILCMYAMQQAAQEDIEIAGATYRPNVNLQMLAQKDNKQLMYKKLDVLQASVVATVPLYDASISSSKTAQARHNLAECMAQLCQTRRDITKLLVQSWNVWQSKKSMVKACQAQVDASVKALECVIAEAQNGGRTELDVLNAQQELLNAKVGLVQVKNDEVIAFFTILSSMGRLTAMDIFNKR